MAGASVATCHDPSQLHPAAADPGPDAPAQAPAERGHQRRIGCRRSWRTPTSSRAAFCRMCSAPARRAAISRTNSGASPPSMGAKRAPALAAVAHSLLLLIYETLRTGQLYQERNVSVVSEGQRQRLIRHHIRRLGKLGIAKRVRPSQAAERAPEGAYASGTTRRLRARSPAALIGLIIGLHQMPSVGDFQHSYRPRKPNPNQPGTASGSTI